MTDEEWRRYRQYVIENHPESLTAAIYRFSVAIEEALIALDASRAFALMRRFLLWLVRLFDRGEAV